MPLANGWVPSAQVPLMFGPLVSCGLAGDEITGAVQMPLFADGNLQMYFTLPSQQSSIQVAICAQQNGSPAAPLLISLYNSLNGLLASASYAPSGVFTSPNWTQFVMLTPAAPIPAGSYYVQITSPSSSSTANYLIYFNIAGNEWIDPAATGAYSPPSGTSYGGNSGYSSIWVKDSSGSNLVLIPFGVSGDSSLVSSTTFTAESSYQINCLVPWLSDMEFSLPNPGAFIQITDDTTGIVLGSAAMSQYYNSHGIQGLEIFQFSSPVQITAGHSYTVSIVGGSLAYEFSILIRGSQINPEIAGTSAYWAGGLALGDFSQSQARILDYPGTTGTGQNGHGGIGGTDMLAARIVPNFTDTITSVKLRTSTGQDSPPASGNYPSGTPIIVSLYASNENAPAPEFANPTGPALASARIDSGQVPLSGFFEITTNFPVTKGVPYWLVWSAPSGTTSFVNLQRCVSAWRNLAVASQDSGSTWAFLGQGPTDLNFAAISSNEMLGSPYDNGISIGITAASFAAQPFSLASAGTISSVFIYPFATGGVITATIYPDNGSGTGPNASAAPLGSGSFDTKFLYFYSGAIIPLQSGGSLNANTKYWIVLSSDSGSSLSAATYWTRPVDPPIPAGYEVLSGSGSSWAPVSSEVASLIFIVGLAPSGVVAQPQPTALTITAQRSV